MNKIVKDDNTRKIGSEYERVACEYLKKNGYEILEQNFRCRIGEIDIIARDDKYLCFIEVKYRKDSLSGYASEAVNARKQRIIIKVARFYILKHHISDTYPCRFDVVAIDNNNISLLKNVIGVM